MKINKKDWQLYQNCIGIWQERYIAALLDEYEMYICDKNILPSQRFWALEKRIREEKKNPCVICELSKDEVLSQIKIFLENGTIIGEDLKGFSNVLIEELVKILVREDRYLFPSAYHPVLLPPSGAEVFKNGIFSFNVSALWNDINSGLVSIPKHKISIRNIDVLACDSTNLNMQYVSEADCGRPLLLFEIAPDALKYSEAFSHLQEVNAEDYIRRGYVLADGNHRIAKARLNGISELPVYLIPMEVHTNYLYANYKEYAEYWNSKLSEHIACMYGIRT